jgi:hypothetical protein
MVQLLLEAVEAAPHQVGLEVRAEAVPVHILVVLVLPGKVMPVAPVLVIRLAAVIGMAEAEVEVKGLPVVRQVGR